MLPEGVRAVVEKNSYEVPAIFKLLAKEGDIAEEMMYNTFNMGLGMILALEPEDVDKAIEAIRAAGEEAYVVGRVEAGEKELHYAKCSCTRIRRRNESSGNYRCCGGRLDYNTKIVGVISNNRNAYAMERAKNHGIAAQCISPKDYETREKFNEKFMEAVEAMNPDLIVLAGFLVVIPEVMIARYRNRMINVHPSLIPSFCGTGYYGLKVHEAGRLPVA